MSTDTLRQIADRLVSNSWETYIVERPEDRNWMSIADAILGDGRALARAYIAEHAADDAEAYGADWLRSIGFRDGQDGELGIPTATGASLCYAETGWFFGWDAEPLPDQPTRGHVRRLLAALGAHSVMSGA